MGDAVACVGSEGFVAWMDLPASVDGVVDEGDEAGCHDDVCDISRGIENRLITDPNMTRRHPSTNLLISPHLFQTPRLRDNMRNRTALAISHEMVRHRSRVLIHNPSPSISVTPPLKLVLDSLLLLLSHSW